MLEPHPNAALEYWFFRVNAGSLALLVDWIARRRLGELWLRASIHSPSRSQVLFERLSGSPEGEAINLTSQHTSGQVDGIAWELEIDHVSDWIAPDIFPARLLRVTDLALTSAPQAVFSGWISHGPYRVELKRMPGLISHYWGRQLPEAWWWVSANQFDREGVAVECTVFRSALWGLPLRLPLAYLYLRQPGESKLLMSPPALARVTGTPDNFHIEFRPPGSQPIHLIASGGDYNDLGEGILNTLVGNLEIRIGESTIARAVGNAALERRERTSDRDSDP